MSKATFAFVLATLAACKPEYTLAPIVEPVIIDDDTDTGDTDTEIPTGCTEVTLNTYGEMTFDWNGAETSWCMAWFDPVLDGFMVPHDLQVDTFTISGYGNIQPDPYVPAYAVRLTQVDWPWAYPSSSDMHSEDLIPVVVNPTTWYAEADSNMAQPLDNNCYPDCDYAFVVEIRDEYTPLDEGNPDACNDVYGPDVTVCLTWKNGGARERRVQSDTSCTAGSGRFRLVPSYSRNRDGDSNKSVVWRPMMISGTGTMTGAAWITSATPVVTQGQALRVIKSGQDFEFDVNDQLIDSIGSVLLPGNGASFQEGVLGGLAPFVITEAPSSTSADMQVDMTWTCAAAGQDAVTRPQGYVFHLPDVGCNLPIPQKFVIRPVTSAQGARDHMTLEYYGLDADRVHVPLTVSQAGGYDFRIDRNGLVVEGRLVSASSQGGAVLDINSISITGTQMCTPGTYTIPAL